MCIQRSRTGCATKLISFYLSSELKINFVWRIGRVFFPVFSHWFKMNQRQQILDLKLLLFPLGRLCVCRSWVLYLSVFSFHFLYLINDRVARTNQYQVVHIISSPFLRSDTETDFPRPVRSSKRSRFAATVFVRSKPVNRVRILPQMCMFLTDTTKTDVLHILVRTHLSVLTCQHSCMFLVIIDQICRKRNRSILIMV